MLRVWLSRSEICLHADLHLQQQKVSKFVSRRFFWSNLFSTPSHPMYSTWIVAQWTKPTYFLDFNLTSLSQVWGCSQSVGELTPSWNHSTSIKINWFWYKVTYTTGSWSTCSLSSYHKKRLVFFVFTKIIAQAAVNSRYHRYRDR